jgi:protein gp37
MGGIMGANTEIEWATHTFNPWVGCQRVSPGCTNCYAEAYDKRVGGRPKNQRKDPEVAELRWGPKAPRVRTSDANWRKPLAWDQAAVRAKVAADLAGRARPERPRVFCASLADVFEKLPKDHPQALDLPLWRLELFELIWRTPNLDWLLLTKRPENVRDCLMRAGEALRYDATPPRDELRDWIWRWMVGEQPPDNVWLGTTVEDQQRADERIPELLAVPAAVRFLSCEPLLERIDLLFGRNSPPGLLWKTCQTCEGSMSVPAPGGGKACPTCYPLSPTVGAQGVVNAGIDWVIVGGESGPGARPFHLDWARNLVRQVRLAGAAPFVKQLGTNPILEPGPLTVTLLDPAGGDPNEWPEDLRVREFPQGG